MTSFPAIRERLLQRLSALLEEGEGIRQAIEVSPAQYHGRSWMGRPIVSPERHHLPKERFHEWRAKLLSALTAVVPEGHINRTQIEAFPRWRADEDLLTFMLATLRAVISDFAHGMYDDTFLMIRAQVAADFLEQAQVLLDDGYYIPAAVLAGAVLEDALRKLSLAHGLSVVTKNNKPKTLDPLISDLAKSGQIATPKAQELRSWAALRNAAAHGKPDEVEPEAVRRMITGVAGFVGDHLR